MAFAPSPFARPLVRLPARSVSPARALLLRTLIAVGLLTLITLIVYFDRDAYIDNNGDDAISLIDALYYATVTMTTTGYGDIVPVATHARVINAIVITPLRIAFLVLLVGTTIEVLANEGRRMLIDARWRKQMRNHVVLIGYGTKGRAAAATMRSNDISMEKVVVIDSSPAALAEAAFDGLPAIEGDGSRREILRRAEVSRAREVIITLDRDDSAILTTLTVRQLNPSAHVVVAVREHENVSLVRQSGADSVVTSSDAVGRLLGLSAVNPSIGTVIEDLLSSGEGLEIAERRVTGEEVGRHPGDIDTERVVAVVRNQTLRRFYDPAVATLETGDRLVVVRRSPGEVTDTSPESPRAARSSVDDGGW